MSRRPCARRVVGCWWSTRVGVDVDLVGDVTEMLTSLYVRLYGRWVAANRVWRVVGAVTGSEESG